MGIGVSLFLLAVGAILTFAVHVSNSGGFDINTIGVILMVVGALGLVVSMSVGIFFGAYAYGISTDHWNTHLPDSIYYRLVPDADQFGH